MRPDELGILFPISAFYNLCMPMTTRPTPFQEPSLTVAHYMRRPTQTTRPKIAMSSPTSFRESFVGW